MRNFSLILSAVVALCPAVMAQGLVQNDDGSTLVVSTSNGGPSTQVPGTTTTLFTSNNQFAGNMFDVTVGADDLVINQVDCNITNPGGSATVNVWYRAGTSVGFESSSAGWTLMATATAVSSGLDVPTVFDVSGNGVTFAAGQSYGMFVYLTTYLSGVQAFRYTNGGPNTYTGPGLNIRSHCGKGTPEFTGSTFLTRIWNGSLHYDDAGCAGPDLSVAGATAGGTATATVDCATAGGAVVLGYSLAGGGPVNVNPGCALLTVSLSPPFTQVNLTANATGTASFTTGVPPGTTGVNVWAQAFDAASCTLTNGVQVTL